MKVRIQDIAKAANVSPATVSNVLNNTNRVSEETRMRVLELARTMGYRNPEYVNLKHSIRLVIYRKTGKIVIDSQFFSELISGIEHACRQAMYDLIITYVGPEDEKILKNLIADRSQPLLLLATEMTSEDIRPFLKFQGPLVVLDSHFMEYSFHCAAIDNLKAGYLAGSYLVENGHKHFGLIASAQYFNNMRDRRAGFEMALRERGFALQEADVFYVSPTADDALMDMENQLVNRTTPVPTGIFAFNDIACVAALRAFKSRGLKIPHDVSLIGMDNMSISTLVNPPLTTIHVPKFEFGSAAAEQLIALSKGKQAKMHIAIDPSRLIRESVANLSETEA